jgi:flavin-dependent dehydrogenase
MVDNGAAAPNTSSTDYDAVIVGASLAGCTAAIFLARQGARVAIVEKQPDPAAFKRICTHYIQASAVPTLERAGLLEPIVAAGGVRSGFRAWTPWGRIAPPPERASYSVNLRREVLDPLLRETAAETPGVEMLLGRTATRLLRSGAAFDGVVVRERDGEEAELRGRLVVGADGRDSKLAEMAGVKEKVLPHNRFAYGGYFEGPMPEGAPDASVWFADPQWGAAFPTDSGLCFYAAMPTKKRLSEFKRDPEAALVEYLSDFPEPPPIRSARLVGEVVGKIEMPNRVRTVTAPGLALIGDAALAADPLFGVGCGWAFQSAEWMADAVAPALAGEESMERGLRVYRRRHAKQLRGHTFLIHDYSSGRKMNPIERLLFSAAARDEEVAVRFDRFGTRQVGPAKMFATTLPRAALVNLRHSLRRPEGSASVPGGRMESQPG